MIFKVPKNVSEYLDSLIEAYIFSQDVGQKTQKTVLQQIVRLFENKEDVTVYASFSKVNCS